MISASFVAGARFSIGESGDRVMDSEDKYPGTLSSVVELAKILSEDMISGQSKLSFTVA